MRLLTEHLNCTKTLGRNGANWSRGAVYSVLSNPIYIGKIVHKGLVHDGLHEPLIEQSLWDQVQVKLATNTNGDTSRYRVTEISPLAGKLFDRSGERLVSAHSCKRGRRYRYYVSSSLMSKSETATSTEGWRLPAKEIESFVSRLAREVLSEATAETLAGMGVAQADITQLLRRLSQDLAKADEEILLACIERVELSVSYITLHLTLKALLPEGVYTAEQLTLIQSKPLTIKRRGIEMRLVIPGWDHRPGLANMNLINTIAKAHNWYHDWYHGEVSSIRAIADREGLSTSYVGDVIRLAFLSPKIVEAIVSGRQPAELVSNHLLVADLPLSWAEQEHLLNF